MYVLNRRRPEVYSVHRTNSHVAGSTKHVIDFNDGRRLPKDDLQEIEASPGLPAIALLHALSRDTRWPPHARETQNYDRGMAPQDALLM
jgi:hypothetical protein